MILTGENISTLRETSTTNLTFSGLGLNPGLSGAKSATNHLSRGTTPADGDVF